MKIELEVEKEVEDEDCIKASLSSMTFSELELSEKNEKEIRAKYAGGTKGEKYENICKGKMKEKDGDREKERKEDGTEFKHFPGLEEDVKVEVRIDFDTLFDSDLVFGVAVAVNVTLEVDVGVGVGVDVEVVEGRRSRDDGVREGKVSVKSFSPTTVWSAFFPSLCCLLKERIFPSDVPYG